MVTNNSKSADQQANLKWMKADDNWPLIVKTIYGDAKKNPFVRFYQQSDITLLWMNCAEHARYILENPDQNATMYSRIMERYDGFNLSLKGRLASGLTIAPDVTMSQEQEDSIVMRIAERVAGAVPAVDLSQYRQDNDADDEDEEELTDAQ